MKELNNNHNSCIYEPDDFGSLLLMLAKCKLYLEPSLLTDKIKDVDENSG